MTTKQRFKKINTGLMGRQFSTNSAIRGQQVHKEVAILDPLMNTGKGADFNYYGVEVKSKDITSNSPWTVTSATAKSIISTEFDESTMKEKLQQWLVISLRDGVVINEQCYDFRHPAIQRKFANAYNTFRNALINNEIGNSRFMKVELGQFEFDENKGNWSYRIPVSEMTKLFNESTILGRNNNLLEFE